MPAKFISAPDKLPTNDRRKMLIVDADWRDIEALGLLCMTQNVEWDFFLYGPTSIDKEWLDHAVEDAHLIIMNNNEDSDRHINEKTKLKGNDKVVSFGAKGDEYAAPLDCVIGLADLRLTGNVPNEE